MSEQIYTTTAGVFTLTWGPPALLKSKKWRQDVGVKGPSRSSRTVFFIDSQYVLKVGEQSAQEAAKWQTIKDTKHAGLFVPVLESGVTSRGATPWVLQPFVSFRQWVRLLDYDRIGKAFVYDVTEEFGIRDIGPGANWGLEVGTGRALVYDYAI